MNEFLSGSELARMILDLRAKGWTDTQIIEHILTIIGENKNGISYHLKGTYKDLMRWYNHDYK